MFLASPALGLCLLEPCTELGNPFFKSERRMLVALPVLLKAYQAEVESLFFKTQPFTALIRNDNIKKKALCRERCASQNLEVCASCLLGLLLPPWAKHHPLLCFAFSFQLQEKARRAQKITRPPLSCVPPAPRSQSSPAALLLSSSCLL